MYGELFDEKHRLIKFTTLTPGSDSVAQSGEYEDDILCEDCDNRIIGSLENYASKVLYAGQISVKQTNYKLQDGLEFAQVDGLDYKKFKLFLLSLLWRASISNKAFFQNVSLGPYEEKIRQMIINNDAGSEEIFPCVLLSYRKTSLPEKIIMAPKKIRLNNKIGYYFMIAGIVYIFIVSEKEQTDWILEAAIKNNGGMKLIFGEEESARKMLNKFLGVQLF
jgi:hypothetical protein